MRYKCGNCNRFIKFEKRTATEQEIRENGYPTEYDVPICKKCGELSGYEVDKVE